MKCLQPWIQMMLVFCVAAESLHPCLQQEPLSKLTVSGSAMLVLLSKGWNITEVQKMLPATKHCRRKRYWSPSCSREAFSKGDPSVFRRLLSHVPCSRDEVDFPWNSVRFRTFQADWLKLTKATVVTAICQVVMMKVKREAAFTLDSHKWDWTGICEVNYWSFIQYSIEIKKWLFLMCSDSNSSAQTWQHIDQCWSELLKPSVNDATVSQPGREQKAEGRGKQHSWIRPLKGKQKKKKKRGPPPAESGGRGKYRRLLHQPTHHEIYCCIITLHTHTQAH